MTEQNQNDEVRAKRELLAALLQKGKAQGADAPARYEPPRQVAPPTVSVYQERPSAPTMPRHPVRTQPMKSNQGISSSRTPTRTETGLFTYDQIGAVAVFIIRLLALCVLFGSFFGSVLAVDGNWKPTLAFWQGINPQAAVIGIALQTEITLMEWWRGANWKDPLYLIHLAIDAGLTFVGYWPYVREALTAMLATLLRRIAETSAPLEALLILSGIVFFVLCVLAARFPEMVFVKPQAEASVLA